MRHGGQSLITNDLAAVLVLTILIVTVVCQALFATVLPEILDLLARQSKWSGKYYAVGDKR